MAGRADCHGDDGRGDSGPDLKREVERSSDSKLIGVMVNGYDDMDPIEITQDEAQMIVDYMRELFPS